MRRRALLVLLAVALWAPHAQAQAPDEYTFRTLARPESTARFNNPQGVAVGADGTIYVADTDNHTIRKMTPAGEVTTLAGLAGTSGSADGVGTAARFSRPTGIAVDGSGTLYVADRGNSTIRKITPLGTVTTLAGSAVASLPRYVNGTATEARFSYPSGVAVDGAGTVYVADSDNCAIRKITSAGVVSTLAGPAPSPTTYGCQDIQAGVSTTSGFVDGIGSAARFSFSLRGVAVDAAGIVYVADGGNLTIRKITQTGAVSSISAPGAWQGIAVDGAGTMYVTDWLNLGVHKIAPDGSDTWLAGMLLLGSADGIGRNAQFQRPTGIALDPAGTLYVTDSDSHTIRKITSAAVVTTPAGKAGTSGAADGGRPPVLLTGVAVDSARLVYAADAAAHRIAKITSTGTVTTLAGAPGTSGTADSGSGATFTYPGGIAVDGAGTIYVTESSTIRKITASGGVSTLAGLAGAYGITDGPGSAARFRILRGAAVDSGGTLYVADGFNFTIRKVTPGGIVTTFAGWPGATGSVDGAGIAARFASPQGVAVDASGNVYVADGDTIRKITPGGVVTTLAGLAGSPGSEDGTGGAARFRASAVAVNSAGIVFVADSGNHTIRTVTPVGVVTTLAGTAGSSGSADGIGNVARFNEPRGVAVGSDGTVFVADSGNHTIRTITPGGVVGTLAGAPGSSGSADGSGSAARFFGPAGLAVDATGTVYVSEWDNGTIRKISAGGLVTTIAGRAGVGGSSDGTGADARFNEPAGVATAAGQLVVADTANHTIRSLTTTGVVATLAGLAATSGSANGTSGAARFNRPRGVAASGSGTVYVADTTSHTIRMITASGVVSTLAGSPGVSGSTDDTGSLARFNLPGGVAVGGDGTVYVADTGNHTIRTITRSGVVATLAGAAGVSGTADGNGSAARFFSPSGLAADAAGTVYVADTGNHTIRAITSAGLVSTVGGAAGASGNVDGAGSIARFNAPQGIAIDASGTLYVADTANQLIRQGVLGTVIAPAITTQPVNQPMPQGGRAQFTVTARGNPLPGYQWQASADGGVSWIAVTEGWSSFGLYDAYYMSDATTSTLTVSSRLPLIDGPVSVGVQPRFRCVASSSAGSATSTSATLTVHTLVVNPTAVNFGASQGPVTESGNPGPLVAVTPAQTVTVGYGGPGTLQQWVATADQPWVQVTQGSATGVGQFTVGILRGYPFTPVQGPGYYQGATIRVSAPNLGLITTAQVQLWVQAVGSTSGPFGVFDTPVNGASGVSGSIAVTGWALDDIEVDRVEIWRDLVTGETTVPFNSPEHPGHGKVFIANTLFVPGARPDVEALLGGAPQSRRAGWGYLLLTWGLWNQGNGPYTLHAFAFDREGNNTTLGTKTISVDNAHATKPFGALDVPTYGETKSGSFLNFGWALTPNANTADPRSCTIANGNVFMGIDSGSLTPVTYGDNRTDVAGFFPGFSNGSAGGGHFLIDTTTLTNGTHQIGWYVVDNCGRADGIGSRFFTVLNGSSATPADAFVRSVRLQPDPFGVGPLRVRKTIGEWTDIPGNGSGVFVVSIGQSDRVEVQLPVVDGATYTGAQVVNGDRRDLPLGSSLDAEKGIFYWQPAAGFLGGFDLEFTPHAGSTGPGLQEVVRVRIVVGPPMRMAIDTPAAGTIVEQPMVVAGWAIDLAAADGSGIDTVHVWAYPVAGGDPIFLGVADLGDSRPDVAAIYGQRFERSSFSLVAKPLASGTYDLVVYPHRAATGSFDGAQVVRVTAP